ncbi:hypothetical protein LUZ60_002420 [Juncus effusus]|nr:hypothetical protein LUZ60_002420 [Juncus effusus]
MANNSSLKIIETSRVSPPAGSVSATSLPLTFFDVLWLYLAPVERLFFFPFPHSTTEFLSSHLPALKSSLSLALQSFFPLAGNIQLTPETTDKYEIYYTDGDSISFTIAESDRDFAEMCSDNPREISKLKPLVADLPKNISEGIWPVMAIKATVFANYGLVIGITVHHSSCDGSGSTNFMRAWASICRTNNATSVPTVIVDRSIIPDPDGSLYSTIFNDFCNVNIKNLKLGDPNDEMFLSTFKLKEEHIKLLKEVIFREATKRNITVRSSTIVITYAFVWIGYIKAKSHIAKNKESTCSFAVDHRKWFQPAIPDTYLGNCIGLCFIQANTEDLLGKEGFFVACEAMSKAFDEVKKEGINDIKDWMKKAREKMSKTTLSAAGSPRFRVYDVDFGWGKPIKVEITSISRSGAMSVAESGEEPGGVEVGLCFTNHEMEVFKMYFEESLQHISNIKEHLV